MFFANFCVIIKDDLLYIFQSGGLSVGKSDSSEHISGWDSVSFTVMSRSGSSSVTQYFIFLTRGVVYGII